MERRTTQVRITQWYYSTINNPTWEQAVSFFFRTRMTRIRQNFFLLTLDALWLLMHTIPKYTYRDWHISFSLLTCYMFLKYHWEALSSSVHLKYIKKEVYIMHLKFLLIYSRLQNSHFTLYPWNHLGFHWIAKNFNGKWQVKTMKKLCHIKRVITNAMSVK